MTLIESTGLQVANELAKSALRMLATDADNYGDYIAAREELARLARQTLKACDAINPRRAHSP